MPLMVGSDVRLWGRSRYVQRDEHGVDSGDDRINKFARLNDHATGCLWGKEGREGILRHAPALGVCLNVQVDVFLVPSPER